MEYPEEIYATLDGASLTDKVLRFTGDEWGRRHAYKVGYEAGKAEQADPLDGYSNLTAAISAGEPIDYEKLDGLKVKCVNPEMGTLGGKLVRDDMLPADFASGWVVHGMGITYITAWHGDGGWTLWVEGEIPLHRKTADQLEVGTYFWGKARGDSPCLAYVGRPLKYAPAKTVYYAPEMLKTIIPPSQWVVLEEYGPFQKPEGE